MKTVVISKYEKPDYATQEALNTICSNVLYAGLNVKKILITSVSAGDGKTYTSLLMAQNFASRGMRVLLIDADLRRSQLIAHYKIKFEEDHMGLANYLAGYSTLEESVYGTNIENLYLIPIGRTVNNPIPLFNGDRIAKLIESAYTQYNMVIIDAPPVGLVIDAIELARHCDGSVLVACYNTTTKRNLLDIKQKMLNVGLPILGCVINKVNMDSLTVKKYYNNSYYYRRE